MADSGLDIGTLSGRIELTDNSDVTVDTLTQRITGLEAKFDSLSGRVDNASKSHAEFGKGVHENTDLIGGFENKLVSLGERLAAYETIKGAFHWAEDITTSAHQLEILQAQTGINVEELQVLGAATREYGIDSDQMGRAVFQLSQRIAGGDASAVAALHAMGLSIESVKNLKGEELFLTVTRALGTLQGSMRDTAAADLFGGRMGKAMEAFSTDVDGAIDKARQLNHVADTESVKAAADAAVAYEHLSATLKAGSIDAIGGSVQALESVNAALARGQSGWSVLKLGIEAAAYSMVQGEIPSMQAFAKALDEASAKNKEGANQDIQIMSEKQIAMKKQSDAASFMHMLEIDAAKTLDAWQVKDLDHLKDIGALNVKNAGFIGVNAAQFDAYKKSSEEADKANKKFADGWSDLNSLGATYKDTVSGIDDSIAGSVKYYASLGAKVQDLTDAFPKLTKAQAEAAVEGAKAALQVQKVNEAAALSMTKAWSDYTEKVIALRGTDTQKATASAEKDYEIHVEEAQAKGVTDVDYYNGLWALRNKDIELSDQSRLLSDAHSKESLLKKIADAQDYMNFMRSHYTSYTDMDRDAQQKVIDNLKEVRDTWGQVGTSIDKDTEKVVALSGEVLTLKEYEARQASGGTQDVTSYNFEDKLNDYQVLSSAGPQGVQSSHPLQGMGAPAEDLARKGYSFQEIIDILVNHKTPAKTPVGPRIPGFSEGGIGDFGEGTLAMLHGREAIVPLDKGVGLSGAPNITIHVNGTAQDVARKVADELMRTLKYSRQYGAA